VPARLLHTADWHVGKSLLGVSRDQEHRAVLTEIRDVAADQTVDAVLVAGDLFDQANPSAEASRIVYEGLLALREAVDTVVVVAGNHDSPKRWTSVRDLLDVAGIHVMAEVAPPEMGGGVVFTARDGTECELVGLPWVFERRLVRTARALGLTPPESHADGMRSVLEALAATGRCDGPTVLVGHAHVEGAALGTGRRLVAGTSCAIPASAFPDSLAYVALGHVHRPQALPAAGPATHYSGSPLQLDFGEAGDQKSVRVVDVEHDEAVAIREVPLSAGRRLVALHGTLEELEARSAQVGEDCWLALTVRCSRAEPGLADRVREFCPQALAVHLDPTERPAAARRGRPSLRGLGPRDLFRRYLVEARGEASPSDADLDLFEEMLAAADRDEEDVELLAPVLPLKPPKRDAA
jgi:exonuclease SbcD